ncbi:MAG TPA: methyltransferase [Candidatus Limnocylindrales bacterium]|nr:methyltransferase [Candidatus Limnocylindrales bacterium]
MTLSIEPRVSAETAARLRQMLSGVRVAQAISVAARMRIPDALATGARSSDDVASELHADPPTLYRLLRMLAAAGILTEGGDRQFALTELGNALRADVEGSVREQAILFLRPEVLEAWGNLEHSIRTGENAFAALHREDVWAWRARDPEAQSQFNRAMAVMSGPLGPALAEAIEVSPGDVVADIGGGNGTLLAAVLARHADIRGIVFDQPSVVAEAAPVLEAAGVADRAQLVGGSFFDEVPAAAVYLMKSILHDWGDADSVAILQTIRASARAGSRLLVVERIIGEPNEDLEGKVSDLHMLVMPGGQERTLEEWRALHAAGGWALGDTRPLTAGFKLIESTPSEG